MSVNPFESLKDTIAFDSLDYGMNKRSAWIYGIVMGWDDPSLQELEAKGFWNAQQSLRLKQLHTNFKQCAKDFKVK
jgi:hypothetical protein